MLTVNFIILATTLVFIFWSADRLLTSAVAISDRHAISPIVVGTIIIGIGTSSPEIGVSVLAALSAQAEIAVGNAIGSNIANLWLVCGTAALISGICVDRQILYRLFPPAIAASLLPALLLLDLNLSRSDGIILLVTLPAILYLFARRHLPKTTAEEESGVHQAAEKLKSPWLSLAVYLVILLAACETAVWAAVEIAEMLNLSKLVIGLSVIAIGTSLPELAAALVSAYRRQHSIAIGNILGSNTFNSLGVLAIVALIHPVTVPKEALYRDSAVMLGATLLLWMLFMLSRKLCIGKGGGLLSLILFFSYLALLYVSVSN